MPEHALNCAWSIWEHREESGESYAGSMHKLCTFGTVEEFWGYWNNLPKPSEVIFDGVSKRKFVNRTVQSFSVFKAGIKPEWEDSENSKGGEWFIRKRLNPEVVNDLWDHLLLGMIGETIDPEDEITGARIVHKFRKDPGHFRFEVWLRSRNRDIADKIRTGLLDCLNKGRLPTKLQPKDFIYKEHSAT